MGLLALVQILPQAWLGRGVWPHNVLAIKDSLSFIPLLSFPSPLKQQQKKNPPPEHPWVPAPEVHLKLISCLKWLSWERLLAENKKGRGIVLKDSDRDPNAGRCLVTWLLRTATPPPQLCGADSLPDPDLHPTSPIPLYLPQLLKPHTPALFRSPLSQPGMHHNCSSTWSWGRGHPWLFVNLIPILCRWNDFVLVIMKT